MDILKLVLCLLLVGAKANESQCGQEYVFAFLKNLASGSSLTLVITAVNDSTVVISNTEHGLNTTITITGGDTHTVDIPGSLSADETNHFGHHGISIQSNASICVYTIDSGGYSSASFRVLPTSALGREYFLASHTRVTSSDKPIFSIIGTEVNTTVTIHFRVKDTGVCGPMTLSLSNGAEFSFELDKQDDLTFSCTGDPTGSFISSSKPIAVISGHIGAFIPDGTAGRDTIAEMLPPVSSYGTRHVLHGSGTNRGAVFRIIGSVNNTRLEFSTGAPVRLHEGGHEELDLDPGESICIRTSFPVLVIMYGKGASVSPDDVGDPFMIVVPPVERYGESVNLDVDYWSSTYTTSLSLVMKTAYTDDLIGYDIHSVPSCSYSLVFLDATEAHGVSLPVGVPYAAFVYNYKRYEGNGFHLASLQLDNGTWQTCSSSPCLHDGMCVDDIFNYTCVCTPPYTGSHCQDILAFSTDIFNFGSEVPIGPVSDGAIEAISLYEESSVTSIVTSIGDIETMSILTVFETTNPFELATMTSDQAAIMSSTVFTMLSSDTKSTTSSLVDEIILSEVVTNSPSDVVYMTSSATLPLTSSEVVTVTSSEMPTTSSNGIIPMTSPRYHYATCGCRCPDGFSLEEMPDMIIKLRNEIQASLLVDAEVLSKTIRSRTSAPDNRPSATYMGGGAIAILVCVLVVFILIDMSKLARDLVYGVRPE